MKIELRYAGSSYGSVTVEEIRQRLEDNRNIEIDHETRKITEKKIDVLNEIIQYPEKLDQVMGNIQEEIEDIKENIQEKILERVDEINAKPEGLDYWKAQANFYRNASEDNQQLKKQIQQITQEIEYHKIAAQTTNNNDFQVLQNTINNL